MATYLITGSSRGIGLELAKQLASRPVLQLVTTSAGRVKFVKLDVESAASATEAAKKVKGLLGDKGLDVLFNNAGIMPWTPDGIHAMTDLDTVFHNNVTSVHNVTAAFLDLLKQGNSKTVINVSTTLGSLNMTARFAHFPLPAYKVSKAALNMLTVQYAISYEKEGFKFVVISPGWVKTDMGTDQADITVEQCGTAVLEISDRAERDAETNGKFYNVRVPGWEKNSGLNQYDRASPPW